MASNNNQIIIETIIAPKKISRISILDHNHKKSPLEIKQI